jgi:eukaryotic-like serine/threonine-protein kinase
MKASFVALIVASAIASGIAAGQSTFRGDAVHAGAVNDPGPRRFHSIKWKFPTGDRIVSSAVYQDGAIFFGGDDGNVYAVNSADGRQLWKLKTGGPVSATPAVAGALLYVGSYDGKFYALDTRTGNPRWKFATGGERRFEAKGLHGLQPKNQTIADPFDVFLSSPVLGGGSVFFGSGDGNVYALDAQTGELQWKFQTGDVVHASPAYAGGVVFFGSWDSYFYAVDAKTGVEKWRFHGGEDALMHNQVGFQSSPAVVNGIVYVGCRDSNLYALDAATGKEKWRFNNSGSWVISSPAVTQGKVIFGTSDSALYYVLDAETGKQLAKQQGNAYVFSSPSVAGDLVYLGVLNGTLEARDLKSGELVWDYQTDASRRNRGWVLTADRKFNSQMLFWSSWREAPVVATIEEFSAGSIFSSPLIVGGTVYFGSTDGNLYALD